MAAAVGMVSGCPSQPESTPTSRADNARSRIRRASRTTSQPSSSACGQRGGHQWTEETMSSQEPTGLGPGSVFM